MPSCSKPSRCGLTSVGANDSPARKEKTDFQIDKNLRRKKDALPRLNFLTKKAPYKGLGADSEEKREPASDINTCAVDSLKVLDPERPIREADLAN